MFNEEYSPEAAPEEINLEAYRQLAKKIVNDQNIFSQDTHPDVKTYFSEIIPEVLGEESEISSFNLIFNYEGKEYFLKSERLSKEPDEDIPTLYISDLKEFTSSLSHLAETIYRNQEKKWVGNEDKKIEDLPTKIPYEFLFFSAGDNDFNLPTRYVERLCDFVDDLTLFKIKERKNLGPIPSIDRNLWIRINESESGSPSPHTLRISLVPEKFVFAERAAWTLPEVSVAIQDKNGEKTAYIFSIQRPRDLSQQSLSESDKKLKKDMDREFYRLNKDIPEEEGLEVMPAALASLAITLTILKEAGVKKVVVPGNLPLQWQFHQFLDVFLETTSDLERIHTNMTDRFLRTFIRAESLIPGFKIINYPDSPELQLEAIIDESLWESKNSLMSELIKTTENSRTFI